MNYWTDVLPMILLIACGLSAVARGGGLVATAMLGSVLAAEGNQLVNAFHPAMTVCATACAVALAERLRANHPRSAAAWPKSPSQVSLLTVYLRYYTLVQ